MTPEELYWADRPLGAGGYTHTFGDVLHSTPEGLFHMDRVERDRELALASMGPFAKAAAAEYTRRIERAILVGA